MIVQRIFFNWKYINRRLKKSSFVQISPIFLFVLFGMGMLMMIPQSSKWLSSKVFDGSIMLLSWVEKPFQSLEEFKTSLTESLLIRKQMHLMKDALEHVRVLKNQNTLLELENKRLKELLNVPQFTQANLLTIPCVGATNMLNRQIIFIRAGMNQGIKQKQPAFFHDQLIGQVDRVTQSTGRILLISDESSRVPVYFSESNADGILTGDGQGNLIISYCSKQKKIAVGEKVLTSGLGGVFPPNKYIGQVSHINGDLIYIQPEVNFHKLTYLQIMINHNWDEFSDLSDDKE